MASFKDTLSGTIGIAFEQEKAIHIMNVLLLTLILYSWFNNVNLLDQLWQSNGECLNSIIMEIKLNIVFLALASLVIMRVLAAVSAFALSLLPKGYFSDINMNTVSEVAVKNYLFKNYNKFLEAEFRSAELDEQKRDELLIYS
ncbi:MAG: hypothetical protein HZA03_06220 [Nitrospinae bacterium]|nr:hypothetical protein [Nitrospinota bacterium]